MKNFFGELIGTFILVFIGCGSVGWAILISPLDLWQISLIWGGAVILAIYFSMSFSHAHLNPAVSLGFLVKKDINRKELIRYVFGQFIGAFLAALLLYIYFEPLIDSKDLQTAMIFGEYYPNPGNVQLNELSSVWAFFFEAGGTFLLMLGILLFSDLKLKNYRIINPILVGLLLSVLIYLIAPYTQAGFNPARDFSPRLLTVLSGWDMDIVFTGHGWLSVYIIAPLVGSFTATLLYLKLKS